MYVCTPRAFKPARPNAMAHKHLPSTSVSTCPPLPLDTCSTCSISPDENDEVVRKAVRKLQKQGQAVRIVPFAAYATLAPEAAAHALSAGVPDSLPPAARGGSHTDSVSKAGVVQGVCKGGRGEAGLGQLWGREEGGLSMRASWDALCALVPGLESTECGMQAMPDKCDGWGPIYWAVLRKD